MIKLNLTKLGELISLQDIYLNFDRTNLEYMKYFDAEDNTIIEIEKINEIDNFLLKIYNKDKKYTYPITNYNRNYYQCISKDFLNQPNIYSYDNYSEKESENEFSVNIDSESANFKFTFDKENFIIEHGNSIKVYDNNIRNLKEEYKIFEDGYICFDYQLDTNTIVSKNIINEYKSFKKNINLGYYLLDKLPTLCIHDNNIYTISYDDFGIMNKCILNNMNLCIYKLYSFKKDDIIIRSVHPLVYDLFKPSNMKTIYWIEEECRINNDGTYIAKNIFNINNINNLMNIIKLYNKQNIDISIIMYDD